MDMNYDLYTMCIMTAVIAFLGFCLENAWLAVTKGYMDNRGMRAPFLLGYGGLVMGMYLLLGTPSDMVIAGSYEVRLDPEKENICYFLCTFLIVSIGEIILGTAVKKFCGMDYWDYTWIPMHITKYTSVPTSIGFGLIITNFMGKVFTPLMELLSTISHESAQGLAIALSAVMIMDFIGAFRTMRKTGEPLKLWQLTLKHQLRLPVFRR